MHLTRGEGVLTRAFLRYVPHKGPLEGVRKGVMVATAPGRASAYALGELQSRGAFFIQPGAGAGRACRRGVSWCEGIGWGCARGADG